MLFDAHANYCPRNSKIPKTVLNIWTWTFIAPKMLHGIRKWWEEDSPENLFLEMTSSIGNRLRFPFGTFAPENLLPSLRTPYYAWFGKSNFPNICIDWMGARVCVSLSSQCIVHCTESLACVLRTDFSTCDPQNNHFENENSLYILRSSIFAFWCMCVSVSIAQSNDCLLFLPIEIKIVFCAAIMFESTQSDQLLVFFVSRNCRCRMSNWDQMSMTFTSNSIRRNLECLEHYRIR